MKIKISYVVISMLFVLLFGCSDKQSVPTSTQNQSQTDVVKTATDVDLVSTKIMNGRVVGKHYYFDVYSKSRNENFILGSTLMSLFVTNDSIGFNPLMNPKLLNVNPKFTLNANGYYPMMVSEYMQNDINGIAITIIYFDNQGSGSVLNQEYELICTVETDVVFRTFDITWNQPKSVVNTLNHRFVNSEWLDSLNNFTKNI